MGNLTSTNNYKIHLSVIINNIKHYLKEIVLIKDDFDTSHLIIVFIKLLNDCKIQLKVIYDNLDNNTIKKNMHKFSEINLLFESIFNIQKIINACIASIKPDINLNNTNLNKKIVFYNTTFNNDKNICVTINNINEIIQIDFNLQSNISNIDLFIYSLNILKYNFIIKKFELLHIKKIINKQTINLTYINSFYYNIKNPSDFLLDCQSSTKGINDKKSKPLCRDSWGIAHGK